MSRSLRAPSRLLVSALAGGAVVASALVAAPAVAAPTPASIGGRGQTAFEPGRYIVTLVDDAVATYEGGVRGFGATKPEEGEQLNARRAPVTDYAGYLTEKQEQVAAAVGADIDYSYTLALNGFSADLTAEQAARLAADKNVAAVAPDEMLHVTEAVPSTEFLGLEGPEGVWAETGGVETAGEGVVVGVLDTGIAPENPSFAGDPLGTEPGDAPYRDGETITYTKGDGDTFTGACQTGVQFTVDDCSTKIVGARYFLQGFGESNLGSVEQGEYVSPRDGDGHGSHTGSTAVGNIDVPATVGGVEYDTITGVAPAAKIAAYKVCWSGPDPADTADDGCTTSDMLAAINQAVEDGVDVLNFSIGGGAAQTTISATDEAFLGAAAAGIFVAASAGNDGPGASTLDNASPWITTVAATTIPSYEATATLGNGEKYAGLSITVDRTEGAEPLSGPLVTATSVAVAGAVDARLCLPGTLDPALTEGKIVLCERGGNARAEKSQVVADAGGIGVLLVNPTPNSIDVDLHAIPTIHLSDRYYAAVTAYAQTPGATVTFTPGNQTDYTPPTPQVAGFSSRGPVLADGSDILKPDIAAPGVAILAAEANAEGEDPQWGFLSGTSMAAPHIAGLAALYLGERPDATPAEVKSALMTTAYDTVDENGEQFTDPFAQGAGHVDPTEFFEPGLVYQNGIGDWLAYIQGIGYDAGVDPIDPSNLNLASIAVGALTAAETVTRTVTATQSGTFTASVAGLEGIDVTVEPSTLEVVEGESYDYTVTFNRTTAPLDEFSTGSLTWTSGDTEVRSPIAIQPVTIVAPDEVAGEGVDGSVQVEVTPGGTGDIVLGTTGLSAGVRHPDPSGAEPEHSGSGSRGDLVEYTVEVPEGTAWSRFDLDSLDDTADLDLVVYLLDDAGDPVAGWQSATGAADERVDLPEPEAGTYLVEVSVFAANPSTAWDLVTTNVVPEGAAPLTLDPAVLAAVQGQPITYTASWTGLQPNSDYLGLVSYGDTGEATAISVETGEAPGPDTPVNTAPPTIEGTPVAGQTLTANPGEWDTEGLEFAFQWQRDGEDIAGATSSTYVVTAADEGSELTVVVTATGEGLDPATATSEPVLVKYASKLGIAVSPQVAFSWQRVTVNLRVTSGADTAPGGTLTVKVDGKSYDVPASIGEDGRASFRLPKLSRGLHVVSATYSGDETTAGSKSASKQVWIIL
ncbi:pre-peptidase [Diaminobutyricimonas aerilata]|uniref:Pre-peptidase n=1 Tax=Diaminobutyricimonas aerilata TaxID=1162967 RepID=A0A2M9CMJ4_9MICO|nr:S8 family serine peptidase [Diaminobutyricimonas aerilata]PJJ73113.1 pre-peptidase [Diaminobutyricimonas aerilata]